MATKLKAAFNRLFKNVFICKNCKHKIRVDSVKVLQGKVRCRKCKGQSFRQIKKK